MLLDALIWFLIITSGAAFLLWTVVLGLFLWDALSWLVRAVRASA